MLELKPLAYYDTMTNPLRYNRFEDLLYLGRGVEVVPWLHRRDARALRGSVPLLNSVYAQAVHHHPWNRDDDFRDVYITMTRNETRILLVFPALPHARDYLRVPPHVFPDASLLESMYMTLQLRAIRCVTDDWVTCDVFRSNGTTWSMVCTHGDRGERCTRDASCNPSNAGRTERPAWIPIGTTVYLPQRFELALWHERPPLGTQVAEMAYASRVDQMIPLVRGQMSTF